MPRSETKDWTIISILSWTESYFKSHSIDSPRLTAEILLAHCLGIQRLDLYLQHDRPFEKDELSRFKALIKRRVQHEPVAYITGMKGFFESDFKVSRNVLIPRPDTETIVEQTAEQLEILKQRNQKAWVLELGTGSGAIVVSLSKLFPEHVFFASDMSLPSVMLARENDRAVGGGRVMFCCADWLSGFKPGMNFDLIVSNPPYIPTRQVNELAPEITRFEPVHALDGGPDGLDCYRVIIKQAASVLKNGGSLLLEIGYDQKQGIQGLFKDFGGYQQPEFIKDLAGHHRVVSVKKEID